MIRMDSLVVVTGFEMNAVACMRTKNTYNEDYIYKRHTVVFPRLTRWSLSSTDLKKYALTKYEEYQN